ncbi:hypothetical protein BP6252_10594 [Coleophoma cylindrospora]|uniref:serine--tRNA ligase n=1 Tax=Coleophoma cylindrospora TaxID=1849047 RepID=A0A3D8QT04_9HELO|nr:hypothetical protein BP6252_10594 [Coleophoma cylindrospora]
MSSSQRSIKCLRCQLQNISRPTRRYHASPILLKKSNEAIGPKTNIDIKRIRTDAEAIKQNCIDRNYKVQASYPERILQLHRSIQGWQKDALPLRQEIKQVEANLKRKHARTPEPEEPSKVQGESVRNEKVDQDELLERARVLKEKLVQIQAEEDAAMDEIVEMAAAIPNSTSDEAPRGHIPKLVDMINEHPNTRNPNRKWRSHTDIGSDLSLLDFAGAATTSGWGWYFLLNEAAQLEQALIQYALKTAMEHGWTIVSPPTMVYGSVAAACGFQPRDQNGETQIYNIAQSAEDVDRKPQMSLVGTAEIPLAGMKAKITFDESKFPMKVVGVSRAYRAEAGARGVDTKGLYRVHEFTKVEMFGWSLPEDSAATALFDEMLSIQTTILKSLGLHCRILEMPSTDLGASAIRKRDIEAFFPSRQNIEDGFGEVTSASICTDYQTRRLATRVRAKNGTLGFPFTVNGTAMAVPRVLAAILENGWDEEREEVKIPEVLWPWMGGMKVITRK